MLSLISYQKDAVSRQEGRQEFDDATLALLVVGVDGCFVEYGKASLVGELSEVFDGDYPDIWAVVPIVGKLAGGRSLT